MRIVYKDPIFLLAAVFILLTLSLTAVSMTSQRRQGQIEVNVTYPKGISLNNIKEGRTLHLEYISEYEIGVYLLGRQEAEDLRRPSFFKDIELPPSLHKGKEGSISFKIDGDGDYELMFYNDSFTKNVLVEYELDMGMRIEDGYFKTSLISTALITLVLVGIVMVRFFKKKALSRL
ncbi:MAG: hypothetical protein QCI82_02635 [Candidatus Thermoplasmatota archaeon]|nr:hypothetical protein [Candidatus Thermoplasmatota archaeon]